MSLEKQVLGDKKWHKKVAGLSIYTTFPPSKQTTIITTIIMIIITAL
jgi:hypothetical protein